MGFSIAKADSLLNHFMGFGACHLPNAYERYIIEHLVDFLRG
jgi:hypothetical protein